MQQIPPPEMPSHETDLATPDAFAVCRHAVPATAPPFDDEDTAEEHISGNEVVSPTAVDPSADDGAAANADRDSPVSPPASVDHDESDQGSLHPPAGWPTQFAQVMAETLAGARPARQLTPWTTEQARRRIRQLGPLLATNQRPKVRRVMTSAPAAGVLEMTAVVGFGPRIRVLALRLELEQPRAYRQAGRRWCCTTIETA